MARRRFEYREEVMSTGRSGAFFPLTQLNRLGVDGWKVVHIGVSPSYNPNVWVLLAREIVPEPDDGRGGVVSEVYYGPKGVRHEKGSL